MKRLFAASVLSLGVSRVGMMIGFVALAYGALATPSEAAEPQMGEFVVEISSRTADDSTFIGPDESVWVYFYDRPRMDRGRLAGKIRVRGAPPVKLDPLVGKIPVGAYRVYLLKQSDDFTFAHLGCGQEIEITARSRARISFPLPYPCKVHLRYARNYGWNVPRERVERDRAELIEGEHRSSLRIGAPQLITSPPFGLTAAKIAQSYFTHTCPELSKGLWNVYRQVIANPPSRPTVYIAGPWDGSAEGLSDMEFDARQIRILVTNLKRQCWGWLENVDFRPEEAALAASIRTLVDQSVKELNELHRIADILERVPTK